jgi:hypothetical protein
MALNDFTHIGGGVYIPPPLQMTTYHVPQVFYNDRLVAAINAEIKNFNDKQLDFFRKLLGVEAPKENNEPPATKAARETVDNLLHGRLPTRTIEEVKSAADRALQDRRAGNTIGKALRVDQGHNIGRGMR